ncbi:MAG: TetR/AcrR family transcriptional regulator, partial [Bdellovibrionota bacterium]
MADKTLTEKDLTDLSLRDVAKRAGVSHTAPYKHFRDKNQLLLALVQQEFKALLSLTGEVSWRFPDHIESQLTAIADHFFNVALKHPRKFKLLLGHVAEYTADEVEALIQLGLKEKQAQIFWSALIGAGVHLKAQNTESFTRSLIAQ